MAKYELMIIIDPSISEEDRNASIDNLKSILEKNSAKITKEDIWAEKKLAYKINKSDTGYYILYELDLD
jgi:small subunit ribosomal protein S6